jgi:hypothetical protein
VLRRQILEKEERKRLEKIEEERMAERIRQEVEMN